MWKTNFTDLAKYDVKENIGQNPVDTPSSKSGTTSKVKTQVIKKR